MSTNPPPLALAVGAAIAQALTGGARPASVTRTAAAGLLGTASTAMMVAAVREFRRTRTTVNPLAPAQATALVTTGANQLSRNPMYLGMAGLLASHALLRGRLSALLPAAVFVVAIDRGQIAAEESALRERFPGEYESYARQVPRWLDIAWRGREKPQG